MRTIDPSTGAAALGRNSLGAVGLRAGLVAALLTGGWVVADRMSARMSAPPTCTTLDCTTYEVELRDELPPPPRLSRAAVVERLVQEPIEPGRIEGATHCAFHDRDGALAAWRRLGGPDRSALEEYCQSQGIRLP